MARPAAGGLRRHLPTRSRLGGFPTNDGLTLVIVGWPYAQAQTYKADLEHNYLATLTYGAGWALVGDAGYNKDSITAQGISDAFRDA